LADQKTALMVFGNHFKHANEASPWMHNEITLWSEFSQLCKRGFHNFACSALRDSNTCLQNR